MIAYPKDESLDALFDDLASRQQPMDEAFNQIIFENIEDLYECDMPKNPQGSETRT